METIGKSMFQPVGIYRTLQDKFNLAPREHRVFKQTRGTLTPIYEPPATLHPS